MASSTFAYKWLVDDTDTEGATSSTYTVRASDIGKEIKARVSFTDDAGNDEEMTSKAITPESTANNQATGVVTITGTPELGQTLTGTPELGQTLTVHVSNLADADGRENSSYRVSWYADKIYGRGLRVGAPIDLDGDAPWMGVPDYPVDWRAVGGHVLAVLEFRDDKGNRERLVSAPTKLVPGPIKYLTIVDTSDQSEVASVTLGIWTPYGALVTLDDSATGSYAFRLDLEDDAANYNVRSVEISLDYYTGNNGSGFGSPSRVATSTPYTLDGEDDEGTLVGRGLPPGNYLFIAKLFSVNPPPLDWFEPWPGVEWWITHFTIADPDTSPATGTPTISGTAEVGETLQAYTSSIYDNNGLTKVSDVYQWLADDTEIEEATDSAYTLQASDAGKAIKVRVTFTDDQGNEETLTS